MHRQIGPQKRCSTLHWKPVKLVAARRGRWQRIWATQAFLRLLSSTGIGHTRMHVSKDGHDGKARILASLRCCILFLQESFLAMPRHDG